MSNRLSTAADRLRPRLAAAKSEPVDFAWYPYDSLSNVAHVERLLGAEENSILAVAQEKGVLDVGCGDGDMSFLFESMGCKVDAVDNPRTHHNGMRGVRTLHGRLKSSIEIHERDIDAQFGLPDQRYGLTLFLGILYHLKNPFYVMEALARCSDYCVLSTRVARQLPDGSRLPSDTSIAYLLDTYELNQDDSKYWIFSETALRRLLIRSGWKVCQFFSAGDTSTSDPVHQDERAFMLLQSHYGLAHLRLISGWYDAEFAGWRWTKKEFSIGVPDGGGRRWQRITMRLFLPPVLIERLGTIELRASEDGQELEPLLLREPGDHTFQRRLSGGQVIRFSLDKALQPGELDVRELGVIVSSIEFE
jgi:tRNA (mo5U34)-methyltransferase